MAKRCLDCPTTINGRSARCTPCRTARRKLVDQSWRANNRARLTEAARLRCLRTIEATRARRKRWRDGHARQKAAINKAWYEANKTKASATCKRWATGNKDVLATRDQKRRARLRDGKSPGVSAVEWREIKEAFGDACAYCLRRDTKLTRDHVVPITRGGLDAPENIVPACVSCNTSKGNKILVVWYCARFAA